MNITLFNIDDKRRSRVENSFTVHVGFSGEPTAEELLVLPSGVPSCGKQLGESTAAAAAAAAARRRIALSAGVAETRPG